MIQYCYDKVASLKKPKKGSWTDWLKKWWNGIIVWDKLKRGFKKATANATSEEGITMPFLSYHNPFVMQEMVLSLKYMRLSKLYKYDFDR